MGKMNRKPANPAAVLLLALLVTAVLLVSCTDPLLEPAPAGDGETETPSGDPEDEGGEQGPDDEAAPAPPAGLKVAWGLYWVTLSWNNSGSTHEGYEIQKRTGGDPLWKDIVPSDPLGAEATGYVDNDVSPFVSYEYRIRSYNRYGPSSADEGWLQFPPVTTGLLTPPDLGIPEHMTGSGQITLSTNKPDEVRYYYTTDGSDPVFTNPVFDPDVDDSGANTTAVWQYEGIVLENPGDYELRVLARAEGWLDSGVTALSVSVLPKWSESNGVWTVNPGVSWNDFSDLIDLTASGDTIQFSGDTLVQVNAANNRPFIFTGSLTIEGAGHQVVFDANDSTRSGSWMDFDQVTPPVGAVLRFEGVVFRHFVSPLRGAVLHVPAGMTAEFSDATFERNFAGVSSSGSSTASGGAIANSGGTVLVEDSTFIDNGALSAGGAISSIEGTTTIRRSRFLGNRHYPNVAKYGDYESGGAILALGGRVDVVSSFFSGNSAGNTAYNISDSGGAIAVTEGIVNVQGSQFVGHSQRNGYVFHIAGDGSLSVSSSAFYENRYSGSGGGPIYPFMLIDQNPEGLDLRSSTFVDNDPLSILNVQDPLPAPNLLLINTLPGYAMYSTGSPSPREADMPGLYHLSGVNAPGIFQALPQRGPDGQWGTADDIPGDFRLRADADPAIRAAVIDGGDGSYLAEDPADADGDGTTAEAEPTDMLGNSRVRGTGLDIGAVEH